MATYTIEVTELVPNYIHVTVEAESLSEAIAKAREESDQSSLWRLDWECSRSADITGAWKGEQAYSGESIPFEEYEAADN